jgi:hypothetical protein
MEERETARGPATAACPACGGLPRWESLVDGEEERWLAVCRCGRMTAFLPAAPGLEPEDHGGATRGAPRAREGPRSPFASSG